MKVIHRRNVLSTAMMLLSMIVVTAGAQAEVLRITRGSDCDACESDGCTACPQCKTHCKLEVTQGTEKKSCYKPECKTICIPKIRLPWQSCCEPRCAKTKTVKVLKKHSYECPKCEYKWTVVECGDGCCESAAESTPTESYESPQATVPTPPAASYRYFSDGTVR